MKKIDIKSLSLKELGEELEALGEKKFRGKQVYEWLHKKLSADFSEMTNLSISLRELLEEKFEILPIEMIEKRESKEDGTVKFLFRLKDGQVVESVWMEYEHGNSVCISSQAGCRMGCKFCASAIGGLVRNLTPSEMLGQVYQAQKIMGKRVSHVVVMGTGEPLDNYDSLLTFLRMLTDEDGLHISQRNITVSTCGLVEKMEELADKKLQITLAVSLHAPDDETRAKLMPVARKYSIIRIMEACQNYYRKTGRRITFEYSLVEGINDSGDKARALARLLAGFHCHVNLIPVNPIKEREYRHSSRVNIQNFKNILEKYKINVTIRREMGADIDAACGQLRKSYQDGSPIATAGSDGKEELL